MSESPWLHLPVSGEFASQCFSSASMSPRKYPSKKGGKIDSGSNAQFNSQLLQRLGSREMPGVLPAASRVAWSRQGPPEPPIGCFGSPAPPRPLVSVAKDAASVGCQDGGGVGWVAAATTPSARPVRSRRCRRHRSHQRRCAETRAAAGTPSAPVSRGLRDGVQGGAEEEEAERAAAAMREVLG